MKTCQCGAQNPRNATNCTVCGAPLPDSANDFAGAKHLEENFIAPFAMDNSPQGAPFLPDAFTPDDPVAADLTVPLHAPLRPGIEIDNLPELDMVLENTADGTRIVVTSPGGIIGRAGDFSPKAFSPQVSGIHLIAKPNHQKNNWSIEFVGRNATSLNARGVWTNLKPTIKYPIFGGELLKIADMVFRITLEAPKSVQ